METELFAGNDLRTVLDQAFRAVVRHIARLSPESLLGTSDQEIIDGLVADASAACPQLQIDQAEALPVVERSEDVGLYGDGSVITHEVPRWRLVVPFTGDTRIFQYRPSRRALTQPVVLDVRENELELFVDGRIAADRIHRVFDASIQIIQQHLDWARADCEQHHTRLRADVPGLVRQRREQVQELRETQAKLRFPIRHRGDLGKSPVPLTHKAVRLTREDSGAGSSTPRWVLLDSDYEEALRVLSYWRDSLERAPSIADGRGEEEIRDLLVAGLNSVFEGTAASEVFNGDGKTDILIRHDGVNVFIGECKIWDGEASMTEALDQIFRYAVWQDTRTAVLLFIHNIDVSAVIDKALSVITSRSNFVRDAPETPASQYNFVMHAMGDPEQEIRMAFISFPLRPKSARPGRS